MQREPIVPSESGEPQVRITAACKDMWRLMMGLLAYREQVDAWTLAGVPTRHGHKELRELAVRMDGTLENVGEEAGQVVQCVELTEVQADTLRTVARITGHQALGAVYLGVALRPEGMPVDWDAEDLQTQEPIAETWARIERGLRPPKPAPQSA